MADGGKSTANSTDGSESEPEIVATDSERSVNDKIVMMWKLQQKSTSHFQKQMMQILSTMADAQAAQASSHSVSSASAQLVSKFVPDVMNAASAQIRLSTFDPDDTPFTMVEWMDDVTKIQKELGISDTLIVLKAGEALRGRATRFYKHWKPVVRDWASFRRDFEVAFPEQGTPATRVRACLAIVSSNFETLVEYGNAKLASIKRFYSDFHWNIMLSLVEYDIVDGEAKNRICLQTPACEAELLKLLAKGSRCEDAPASGRPC